MLIIVGTSYAAFDFSFKGEENEISTSDISLKLLESNNEIINIENMLPMSDNEGIEQTGTGNVFDFAVETKASSNVNIGYKINIEKLSLDTGYTSFTDDEIKVYLTDTNDNKILGPVKISELNNYNLYEDMNIHNKDDKVQTDKYRIRVWVDKDVDATDWDENTKLGYKFKIGVSSLEEQGKYNISYSPNGGEGVMATSVYSENTQERLRKNTFTRGGYTFKGWSRNTSGEVEYQDKGVATNLTTTNSDKNKTLYALWKPHNYTVKYNANGGEIKLFSLNETSYAWENSNGVYRSSNYNVDSSTSTMTSNEFTLTEPGDISFDWAVSSESEYYDYLYYTIYKNGTALSDTGESTKIGGYSSSDTESNLTYTSVTKTLEAGTYTIAFTYRKDVSQHKGLDRGYVKNIIIPGYDESKAMDNSNFIVGENNKLSKNVYTKSHYTFKGWHTNKNETNIKYQDEASLENLENTVKENEEINLYVIWEINKYNVNVVVQNGTVDTVTKQVVYNTNGTFNLTPTVESAIGQVTCTNNQTGIVENNVLTVSNVSSDTTCTVKFVDTITTLYEDGTIIINESTTNRSSNKTEHGTITNEYEAMSDSNSYIMGPSTQPWKNEREQITSVEIGEEISPISTTYWFYDLTNMKEGDFTNLDTSSVTNMSYMFFEAGKDATTWSIGNLSNWDTSSVTNMSGMFWYAGRSATTWSIGNLSNWDTSSVTNMSSMFNYAGRGATTWSIGDLSNWDTRDVTSMSSMFESAGKSATTWSIGDLSNWDASSVTNMSSMFSNAGYSATTWDIGNLSNWDTSSVTNMSSMFNYAGYSATTWDIGNLSNWDTQGVTDMSDMLNYAGRSATTWNIGNLSNWDTRCVTDMSDMFHSAGYSATTWDIGNLSNWDTRGVTDMSDMFHSAGYSATTWSIGNLSNWDTSSVTNMSSMFNYAGYSATTFSLDLSGWDTQGVTDMNSMFSNAGYRATTWIVTIPSTTGTLTNTTSKWYGSSSSVYAEPLSGKSFTLASS